MGLLTVTLGLILKERYEIVQGNAGTVGQKMAGDGRGRFAQSREQ